jgi:hypothetical protein
MCVAGCLTRTVVSVSHLLRSKITVYKSSVWSSHTESRQKCSQRVSFCIRALCFPSHQPNFVLKATDPSKGGQRSDQIYTLQFVSKTHTHTHTHIRTYTHTHALTYKHTQTISFVSRHASISHQKQPSYDILTHLK